MSKPVKKPWTPPEDLIRELMDAAEYRLGEDEIVPVDVQKPHLERLRDIVNGMLALPEAAYGIESADELWGCLKLALLRSRAELQSREYLRKSLQREENLAKYRLESLKAVAMEMLEAYGTGSEEIGDRLHSPLGDLRRQRNSKPFVWVDEQRIDEIPEKLGEFTLVKVEKVVSKTGVGAYLEDLKATGEAWPEWAEIRPPGFHLGF